MKSLLVKINTKLNAQGGFLKAVSLLIGGTAFAHALTILALPFITRLYTPEDFSRLAVYTGLLGILSVIACLRYEIAIPLPDNDDEAERLLIISIINTIAFSSTLLCILFIFSSHIKVLLGNGYFEQITWLLPLGVLSASLYSAFKYWCTKTKDFKVIARTKIEQATSSVIIQLVFGWFGIISIGMLVGQLFYNGAGVFSLIRKKSKFKKIEKQQLISTYKKYINYPKYSVGEALFNTAGVHLPILIIASIAVSKEAGFLLLASKVMIIPMVLIGAAVSQVYYAHANEKKENLSQFTLECMQKLAILGVGPLVFIGLLSPILFPMFFGVEWKRAGDLVVWMTPWFIMQFIVSPVSMVFHVINRQKTAILLQLFGLILKLAMVYIAIYLYQERISEFYAVSGFLFYFIYFYMIKISLGLKNTFKIFLNKSVLKVFLSYMVLLFIVKEVIHAL